jgi:magnesium transporter
MAVLKDQPATAARVLENFPAETVAIFLHSANMQTAAEVFGHFTPGFAATCLAALEPATAARLLEQFGPDNQVTLLRQLERVDREPLLREMQPELATSIRRLLPWPDGTAGALMEAPLASVPEELSVRDALKRIKRVRRGMKFYLYATGARGQLTGVLSLHELLTSLPGRSIAQIMNRRVSSLSSMMPVQAVHDSPYWQDYHALPVTDENHRLLGVIRQKTLHRLAEQSVRAGIISDSLDTVITVGEMFSVTAVRLLSALIETVPAPGQRRTP